VGSNTVTHADARAAIIGVRVRRTPVPRPPSPVSLLFAVSAFVAPSSGIGAQDIGPVSFRDSLVMRQVAFRAPCPVPAPKAWTLMDSTLGSGLRCSLVEAAARALDLELARRPALRLRGDPRNPLCVRVVVANNMGSTGLPGDWLVVFDLAFDLPAWVMIDRQDGSVVMGIVGRTSGDMPACVVKYA